MRLVVLSPRQWRALREWLGEPEYLQDPELESFVARLMIAATVINPLLEEHFAQFGMDEVAAEAQRRGIVCTPALPPASRAHERAPAVAGHVRAARRRCRRDRARVHRLLRDRRRRAPVRSTPPPAVGEHTEQVFAELGDASGTDRRSTPRSPAPPLAGLRVMDFGIGAVGVEVGRRLAEYGAEVIKIESRAYPDFMRTVTGGEFSPSFVSSSRSKLGFGVERADRRGPRRCCMQLAEQSDVVIENNSTGTMDDLGLGFDDLLGGEPEHRDGVEPADGLARHVVGLAGVRPDRAGPRRAPPPLELRRPRRPRGFGVDLSRPLRGLPRRGGVRWPRSSAAPAAPSAGTHVEVAQVEAVAGSLADLLAAEASRRARWCRSGNRSEQGAPWGLYPCAGEEQWVAITCRDDADWRGCAPRWARRTGRTTTLFDTGACRLANAAAARRAGRRRGRAAVAKDDVAARLPGARRARGADAHRHRHGHAPALPWRTSSRSRSTSRGSAPMVLDGAAFHGDLMVGPDVRPAPAIGEHTRQIATDAARARRRRDRQVCSRPGCSRPRPRSPCRRPAELSG